MRERQAVVKETAVRYRRAKKKARSQILDEFVALTKYKRSYAAYVLRNYGARKALPGAKTGLGDVGNLRKITLTLLVLCAFYQRPLSLPIGVWYFSNINDFQEVKKLSDLRKILTFAMVTASILLAVGCSSGQVTTQDQINTQSGYSQTAPQTQPSSQPAQSQATYQNINAAQAKQLIDNDKTLQIIDVREPDEFAEGHVTGAKLISVGEFMARMGEIDKTRPVLVYCGVGSRSVGPAEVLAQSGYKVYNLANGVSDWTYGLTK